MLHIRTPGYPLFLVCCYYIHPTFMTVIVMQSLLTLVTITCFIWAMSRLFPNITIAISVALTVGFCSTTYLYHETTLLTESLFINCLVWLIIFMILALKQGHVRWWVLLSSMIALTIYVRPSGIYLIGVFTLLLVYLIVTRSSLKKIIIFCSPLAIGVLALMSYNALIIKRFTISPFGDYNLIGATTTYMQPNVVYPSYLNHAIEKTLQRIPKENQETVRNSWKLSALQYSFLLNYDHLHFYFYPELRKTAPYRNKSEIDLYYDLIDDSKKVFKQSISEHPALHVKFVSSMLYQYLMCINQKNSISYLFLADYIGYLKSKTAGYMFVKEAKFGRLYEFYSPRANLNEIDEKLKLLDEKPFLLQLASGFDWVRSLLFENIAWLFIGLAITFYTGYQVIASRFTNTNALLVFCIISLNWLGAILNSLVMIGTIRYASTTHFTYYLSLSLIGLLIPAEGVGKVWFLKQRGKLSIKKELPPNVQDRVSTPTKAIKKRKK
ncbi:MAG: glycosyltransferase family 39 protein [Spirosomataceae bacterium]